MTNTITIAKKLAENVQPTLPRIFLRHYNQINDCPDVDIFQEEANRDYQIEAPCILSKMLDVSRNTIYKWGQPLDFDGMPADHQLTLGYAIAGNAKNPRRVKAGEFLYRAFELASLSEERKLRLISSKEFRRQSKSLLSQILKVEKSYVETWGNNMYFTQMPSKYEIILGYAIQAVEVNTKIICQSQHNGTYAAITSNGAA
jgi:hypothetical protein